MEWYLEVLKKYAEFNGRARRKEYWMFFLINFIIAFVVGFIDGYARANGVLSLVYTLALLIPSISVGVRRMHDTNRSGWWLLLPFVNIVLMVQEGQKCDNQYGPDPKASSTISSVSLSPQPISPAGIRIDLSVADELKKMNELKSQGLLSEEEFAAQKARLLGNSVSE